MTKYIDNLSEDDPIPGQLWACISFLSPEGIKNCSLRGLKIRGVYGTKPEAEERANELQKLDPDFHVFVGEVGKWLPWDPDPSEVSNQVYQEKELNDLMKCYKENLLKAKKIQHERKQDIKGTKLGESYNSSKIAEKLKKKLNEKRKQTQTGENQQSLEKENIKTESIDEKLQKVKELYDKLNKK